MTKSSKVLESKASSEAKEEVLVFSLDADGALFNRKYVASIEAPKIHDVIRYNPILIKQIHHLIEKNNSTVPPIFTIGSMRQSQLIDKHNMQINNTDSVFRVLPIIVEHFHDTMDRKVLAMDTCLFSDYFSDTLIGRNFDDTKSEIRCPMDSSKFLHLYAQMHRAATLNKNKKISFHFYDDIPDILYDLQTLFLNNKELLPANVTLHLHRYNGKELTDYADPVKGVGVIDSRYDKNVVSMVRHIGEKKFAEGAVNVAALISADSRLLNVLKNPLKAYSNFFGYKTIGEKVKGWIHDKTQVDYNDAFTILTCHTLNDNSVRVLHGYRYVGIKPLLEEERLEEYFLTLLKKVTLGSFYRSLEFLTHQLPNKKMPGIDEDKIEEYKHRFLQYQLNHLHEVALHQGALAKDPVIADKSNSENYYKSICLGIQQIICGTKWDINVGGEEVPSYISGRQNVVGKNMLKMLVEIEGALRNQKTWEATFRKIWEIGQKAQPGHWFRHPQLQLFYNAFTADALEKYTFKPVEQGLKKLLSA